MGDQGIIKIGPGGVDFGRPWDEKGHSEIVQIFISHDEEKIYSIQFQYLENGTLVLSNLHGQLSKIKFDVVKFNYPEEYVTSISGTHNKSYNGYTYTNSHCLSSLSIGTNLTTYGPFGRSHDSHEVFHYNLGKDRQFGGFYGSGDSWVSSIGVYIKPLTTLETNNNNNNNNNNSNNYNNNNDRPVWIWYHSLLEV